MIHSDYIYLAGKQIAKADFAIVGGSALVEKVGYTGQQFDQDLGLNYMQARYYDPEIGRFYSNDPIGFRDVHSFNRYAYANNNPYKYVDPTGGLAVPWHGAITFFASLNAGQGFRNSLSIAYRAMQADWEPGSQGSSPEACARHAMNCGGITTKEAAVNHANLIKGALNSGDLGLASHAIQDHFAGGHEGFQFWPGGFGELGFWGTVKHLFADIFPSFSTISSAYSATKSAVSGQTNSNSNSNNIGDNGQCGVACYWAGKSEPPTPPKKDRPFMSKTRKPFGV